jgi:hypothetical protein
LSQRKIIMEIFFRDFKSDFISPSHVGWIIHHNYNTLDADKSWRRMFHSKNSTLTFGSNGKNDKMKEKCFSSEVVPQRKIHFSKSFDRLMWRKLL